MYAVVRVRGRTGINPKIKETMNMLGLTRVNHMVLVKENDQMKGMLEVCKDYVTWGEIDKTVFTKLLEKRGLLEGNKRVSLEYIKSKGYNKFEELAEKVLNDGVSLKDLGIKKVFRLHPPRGGYKSIKKPYPHGALGYRGAKINDLISKMM